MSGGEESLREIREDLSRIRRRLEELADALPRLEPPAPAAPRPVGELLGEDERRDLLPIETLLGVSPDLARDDALLLAIDRAIYGAGADAAALFLATPRGDLEAVARRGFPPGALRVGLAEGLVGRAFAEHETIRAGPDDRTADRLLREHGLQAALALPVGLPDQPPRGVVLAGRRRAAPFGADALAALRLLADRVAVVLGGRPAAGATPAAGGEAEAPFVPDLDLARTAAAVAQEAARRLGAPRVALLLPENDGLTLAAGVGLPGGAVLPPSGEEPLRSAIRTGTPWVAGEGASAPALADLLGAPPRLIVPLAVGGRTAAVLVAGGPSPLSLAALAPLAPAAAAAIRNAELHALVIAALAERRGAEGERPVPPPPVRDLTSLLAVVLGRIALVRERLPGAPPLHADLGVAEEAAWRAAESVRGFLGFAPGHRTDKLIPLDLTAVIRAAVEGAERRWRARGRGPAVKVEIEPLPPVRGSADELREALDHLLENAAEAVAPDSVVSVRAGWDGGHRVEVTVQDTGPGMDDALRTRALEPFFSTKGAGRLGLGLPVAQAVAARHRGTLTLSSTLGEGTTVRLVLPTSAGARLHGAAAAARTGSARVLVVEDDLRVREALLELLGKHGHEALGAADAREGLAVFEREPVDVVFTDHAVGELSGLEIARTVKRLRPGTPVILITGWPGRLDAGAIRESGIDRVIEKPVAAGAVLAALEAALTPRSPPR